MKKKLNIILIISVSVCLICAILYSIESHDYIKYFSMLINDLKEFRDAVDSGITSSSNTVAEINKSIIQNHFELIKKLFIIISLFAIPALLITTLVLLNKTDISTLTAPMLTSFKEKQAAKKEAKKQKELEEAQKKVETLQNELKPKDGD